MQWLKGLTVVELGRLLPAPLVGTVLRDLGATVLKIELLPRGDSLRGTVLFDLLNRGKYSIAITAEQLPALLSQLLPQVDVLLTNYRPETQESLGLVPDLICQAHPHLIYLNLTGSADGRPGHDLNFLAESGILDRMRAAPDQPPLVPSFLLGDILGGSASSLIRLLAALYHRMRTGQGSYVPVYMREEALRWSLSLAHLRQLFGGKLPPVGTDFLSGGMPSYRVYATKDNRYIAVAALEEKFWAEFCQFIGRPDLLAYGRSIGDPLPHRELEALFAQHTWAEWEKRLKGTAFCVTPVYTFDEALAAEWAEPIWHSPFLFFAPPTEKVEVPPLGAHTEWAKTHFGLRL